MAAPEEAWLSPVDKQGDDSPDLLTQVKQLPLAQSVSEVGAWSQCLLLGRSYLRMRLGTALYPP